MASSACRIPRFAPITTTSDIITLGSQRRDSLSLSWVSRVAGAQYAEPRRHPRGAETAAGG
ncbi:hypothetical protein J4732_11980 [Serratia marcescens]|uniref:Uncharacterized protein n=1 Tax=Serratia marcescens TaxID=615 RepID=A0A939NPY6_SERMA|nr:hypothetical protein [Serratia marcescens]